MGQVLCKAFNIAFIIQSLNNYVLRVYYRPGTITYKDIRASKPNRQGTILMELVFQVGGDCNK